MRRMLGVLFSLVVLGLFHGQATADPPLVGHCGRVNALSAPSGSAAGAITIGTVQLALTTRDQLPSPALGTVVCTRRGSTTSGPILIVEPMRVPLCGSVQELQAADDSTTLMTLQILDIDPTYRVALPVRGVLPRFIAESITRGVSGCFQFVLDASGDVVVTSLIGGGSAPATPSRPTPQIRQLPSTSTTN